MSNFAWYSLQIVVATAVFVLIGETVGVADRGLAPALVSLAVAYGVTVGVSALIDWRRASSLRRLTISNELQSHAQSGRRALGHAGDGPQLVRRRRIGQYPGKLV